MAGITQTIPSFINGISEQPDHLKFQGQLRDIVNAIPDVTLGLYKRPGSKRIGTTPLTNVQSGGSWFHYFRDETEGSYVGQVAADGQVRVWRCSDGQLMTTLYGPDPEWDGTVDYTSGQRVEANDKVYEAQATISNGGSAPSHSSGTTNNWLFIEATSVDKTTVQNYLATSEPENLQFLTINDTTFVSSRDSSNANTLIGTTGTTDDRPEAHCAMIELLRTENGRQYGINIYDSSASSSLTTVKRSTRVKISSNTLDESDGTGHCPSIGTEVFSATAASDYTGTSIVDVKTPTTVSSNNIGLSGQALSFITLTSHGLSTGDEFTYVAGSTTIGGLTNGTDYFIIKNSDDAFRIASSLSNAQAGTSIVITAPGTASDQTLDVKQTANKKNLIFRITTLGQQGVSPNYNASANGPGGNNYRCSYQAEVVLLHGGEGWDVGDKATVTMEGANYTIRVEEIETTQLKATLSSADDGLIRPTPTPFNADTAVTADTILAGIVSELPSGITAKVIGPGIYLSSANSFNVEVAEEDLMRVFQTSVNDVTLLPNQCRHGYIVKVSNARMSDEDDYFLRFTGENNLDGSGSWSECPKPLIAKSLTNMPLAIQRTATTTFTVKQFTYQDRRVGDDNTNPMPTFVDKRINKVLFFRNRLAILAGENVILSRPGTLGTPDFFVESALTVSASDPIDISAASMFPSDIFDGIEINAGLLVFSTNQQFLLSTDDTVLNPDTAKLRSVSTFNYNKDISPISLGTTVSYLDNSGKFSRLNEMANTSREGEPDVVEISKLVPTLLPKDLDLFTNSRENSLILIGKTNSDIVFGYKYLAIGDKRQQQAWFKWKLNNPLLYHFIINDEYFYIDTDNFLQSIKLVQSDDDPTIATADDRNFLIHLDNHTTVSGGSYNSSTNLTTFSNVSWLSNVTTPNYQLVVIDEGGTPAPTDGQGRYAEATKDPSSNTFTVPGDWSNITVTIGYLYEYLVEFPRIYPKKIQGEKSFADVNSSLIVHRIKLHFGAIGVYETTLTRVGKDDYTEIYESTIPDTYSASRVPYLEEDIKTIPVYEKNKNVEIKLKSSHPAPATLRAMAWEGDYSPLFYKRA